MPSPPKPWERAGAAGSPAVPSVPASQPQPATAPASATSPIDSGAPANGPTLPNRPANLTAISRPSTGYGSSATSFNSSPYSSTSSTFNTSPYGSSPYGSSYGGGYGSGYGRYGGGYSGFGSTLNRGYGSGYGGGYGYGGYGSYGSGFGSYGAGYGRPGFGGSLGGPPGAPSPNGELPLTARVEQSTAAAFQTIDQIVQAFGGFSQMLESTFFATHSSFMAMVGVAEQFGHLRSYLGRALSVVTWVQTLRHLYYRLRGRQLPPPDASSLTAKAFEDFQGAGGKSGSQGGGGSRPWVVFGLLLVGLPWLMSKLINRLQHMRLEDAANGAGFGQDGARAPQNNANASSHDAAALPPSQIKDLEFCTALYDFTAQSPAELSFKRGDIIAILSRFDPATREPSMWWRGRLRSGPMGFFPANYVEIIKKEEEVSPPVGDAEVPGPLQ